jgi:hypothetical protein
MDVDFPAAHSMDSCWFAVDRDGHVGYFDTGEAGATPFDATIEDPHAVLEELQQLTPRGGVVYHLPGFVPPGPLGRDREHRLLNNLPGECVLCFLNSLDPVRQQLGRGTATQVPASSGFAVILRKPTKALAKRLHESGVCQGCFWYYEREEEDEDWNEPGEHGLFVYHHLCENWISGPYGCREWPGAPLHVDQLPPHLRTLVSDMRFDSLCFAQTPHIQPVEFDTTSSWESAYLSGDGLTIRENSGAISDAFAPDTYAEFYEQFKVDTFDWLKGITIEPPKQKGGKGR